MDMTDFPVSRSPRKELQGQRPPALKVRKDSHKIRKPPIVPHPQGSSSQHDQNQYQQPIYQQPRQPVIIYTVSPKIIHTNPNDFMNLVQRLTGPSPTAPSASSNPFNNDDLAGAMSPAARFATIENAANSPKNHWNQRVDMSYEVGSMEIMGQVMEKPSFFPHGILSPTPALLPPVPAGFFSPQTEPNSVSFFHDMSPALHGNRHFMEGSFMPSPSMFASPRFPSPSTPAIDLFNNFNGSFFDI